MDNDFATGYALGSDSGEKGCNGNGWGDQGWWIIIILFALFGWGGNGWGGNGNNGGGGVVPTLGGIATRSDIMDGFALNGLERGVQGIQQGICDSTYALNSSLMNGFHGVDNAVCQLGYQTQQGFNNLGAQMASCCCDTQRSIDGVKYQMATDTCAVQNTIQNTTRDILDNNNTNTRAILDFLTQDKISSLQAENQTLRFQASQTAQNGYIDAIGNSVVARLQQPTPVPAYAVPAPYPYCVPNNSNCGCGCSCGC